MYVYIYICVQYIYIMCIYIYTHYITVILLYNPSISHSYSASPGFRHLCGGREGLDLLPSVLALLGLNPRDHGWLGLGVQPILK